MNHVLTWWSLLNDKKHRFAIHLEGGGPCFSRDDAHNAQVCTLYLPNACWYLYYVSSDNDAMHFQCIIYIAYHCTNSFSLIAFHWLNQTLPHLFLHEDKQIFLICIQYSEIHCKLIWGKSKSYFVLLSSLTYFQNQRFHVYLGLEGF